MGSTRYKPKQKRRTHTRRQRKQHGGNGSNLRFQYTKDPIRVSWVTAVSQYGLELIRMISKIPYSEYRFEGECDVFIAKEDSNNNTKFTLSALENISGTTKRYNGVAVTQEPAYQIFGGTACEVYNMSYPQAANLYATTDPTGDIDIRLLSPKFTPDDKIALGVGAAVMYTEEHGYNPVSDNYTKWVMGHIANILQILSTKYTQELNKRGFIPASKEDTYESSLADESIQVGPFLVCRLYRNNMIKIQVITKIRAQDETGALVEYADHCIELVILIPDRGSNDKLFKGEYYSINDIIVDSPMKLLKGQVKGLNDRQGISPASLYKLINHYGRLMYITKLIRWMVDNNLIPRPSTSEFATFIDTLKSPAFERDDVCMPPRGCSAWAILQPILPFLSPAYPITKKAKTIRNPEAIKGLGNLEFIESNLFQ